MKEPTCMCIVMSVITFSKVYKSELMIVDHHIGPGEKFQEIPNINIFILSIIVKIVNQ